MLVASSSRHFVEQSKRSPDGTRLSFGDVQMNKQAYIHYL